MNRKGDEPRESPTHQGRQETQQLTNAEYEENELTYLIGKGMENDLFDYQ